MFTLLHEGSHYVAAKILGVPIKHFTWFDPRYLGPDFFSASHDELIAMTAVSYAGGLFTGSLLLGILAVKRSWLRGSILRWLLGLYLVAFGFWEISQGILETAFHSLYITNAIHPFFSLIHSVGYGSAFLGIALYSFWWYKPWKFGLVKSTK